MQARTFNPGQVVITPGANAALNRGDVIRGLDRHVRCDWGDVSEDDRAANDEALQHNDRLLSAYFSGNTRFWIITEYDRSVTTILLPEEY